MVRQTIEDGAKEEVTKIVERAKREIGLAKEAAIEEVYGAAGQMALDTASQVIRKELSLEDHARLIDEATQKMRAAGSNN